ncbi:MAG: DUF5060 domain-containing protein, partial [Bryobacteraceae bacterium]
MPRLLAGLFATFALCARAAIEIEGERKVWHRLALTFDGPASAEHATPNPFRDYRLIVTFTHQSGRQLVVPGFYAADGNAAETSARS